MGGTPTFAIPHSFMGTQVKAEDARVCIAGVPFDIAVTNRSGSRFGPHAIRHASRMLVDGDNPANWRDPLFLPIADVGDFPIALGDIKASLDLIEHAAARYDHLVTLGGDHTIALPLLRALAKKHGPLGLVHFDAHLDTWPDNFGAPYAHGSVFYHAIIEGLVDPKRMIQIGIRSPVQKEIWDWTEAQGVTIIDAESVHNSNPAAIADRIKEVVGAAPTYLSFDIDALDPSQAPGTGTPEIGGLFTWQAMAIIKRLNGLDFKGMDLVEVCPPYDVAEISALAGATLVWNYLTLLEV
jgi:agmatinase